MESVTLIATGSQSTQKPAFYNRILAAKLAGNHEPTLGVKFVSAGLAACIADMVSFPLDTAKVRLQIQGEGIVSTTGSRVMLKATTPMYHGLVGTLCTISRHEGARALYNGLIPGLQRQMCFASIRIGLYDSFKQFYVSQFNVEGSSVGQFGIRMLAGCTTGALAVICAQPTDVVKVRMQAGGSARYSGVLQAYSTIAAKEGIKGLWKGASPNVARNCIVNCCELVTYDTIKEYLLATGLLSDTVPCHFIAGTGSGFVTTIIASPVDVVKTRFMNSSPGTYTGVLNAATVMYKKEGARAFYKGFVPSFLRLSIWNIVMFVSYEQLKRNITTISHVELPQLGVSQTTARYA